MTEETTQQGTTGEGPGTIPSGTGAAPTAPLGPNASAPPPSPPPPTPPRVPPAYPPYYGPPPRKRSPWAWGCGLGLAGCLLFVMIGIFFILVWVMGRTGELGKPSSGDGIAVIYIEGAIASGTSDYSPFGSAMAGSDDIVQQLEEAAEDDSAKAILLRVNSPGGSAAASQEIYNAVIRAKKSGKPIIVSMADVAASGGYYISCPADVIFANPSTMTGSIGVITMHEDLSGLLGKIGIRVETIKSGKLKDMMQPTGPISDEARQVITGVIMEVYDQFVGDVVKGRKMDRAKVLALADGRIYTGQQAKKNGLIDELGGMQEALTEAGKRGKLKGKPEIKEYGRTNLLKDLFGVRLSQPHRPVAVTGTLLYDWVAAQLVGGALQPTSAAPQVKPEGM